MNRLEGGVRRVDRWQQRHKPVAFAFAISKKFGDDNGGSLVAHLAYAGVLALFPLLLILVTVLGVVLAGYPGAREQVLHSAFSEFPLIGRQLSSNIHPLHRSSVVGLIIGLVGLLWGSIGLAQAGLFAMAQVWNLPGPDRPNYPRRLARGLGFIAILGLGLIVTVVLAAFGTYGSHRWWLGVLSELLAVAVNIGQFLLAFRVLTPKVIETRRLVPGAIAGGVAWTALLAIGGYLIGHDLRHDSATYGIFATVLGLLAWVYLGAELTVYAAEINPVTARHLWPRAIVQPPLISADEKSLALEAMQNQRRPEQVIKVSFTPPSAEDAGSAPGEAPRDALERARTDLR